MSEGHHPGPCAAELCDRRLAIRSEAERSGVHRSVEELEAAVLAYVERHNAEPKPFRWSKPADDILASVARFCSRTPAVHGSDLKPTSETRH